MKCWCGNSELKFFNTQYVVCNFCGTLISLVGLDSEAIEVENDSVDFYGKNYWHDHQVVDLAFPSIYDRARNDLTERNLHWLKVLLKYRLPPAKIMELGCAHGSFVALLKHAGYNSSGVEMSPWVVDFGQQVFEVPISVGPIEKLDILPGELDAIVLFDVFEHLHDPVATMSLCLKLLKDDGLLLIQTPEYKEEMNFEQLLKKNDIFLYQLKSDEHLYILSQRAVHVFFEFLGAKYIYFEPAIFSQYDMFFAVSRKPIKKNETELIESALLKTPHGRIALAMLDLRERELNLIENLKISEEDRLARWKQIQTLTTLIKQMQKT